MQQTQHPGAYSSGSQTSDILRGGCRRGLVLHDAAGAASRRLPAGSKRSRLLQGSQPLDDVRGVWALVGLLRPALRDYLLHFRWHGLRQGPPVALGDLQQHAGVHRVSQNQVPRVSWQATVPLGRLM